MNLGLLPESDELLRLLDEATLRWHIEPAAAMASDPQLIIDLIVVLHRANFDLWHEEDQARDPDATDKRIADVKRAIDKLNQRRNDLVETMDRMLVSTVKQDEASPLHSETPAMMVDRLSIMTLKVYHTQEELMRNEATEAHRMKNRGRLQVLMEQRGDLVGCLDTLLAQIAQGERRFKVYRQMKMYNDPELNPVLYRRGGG